MTYSTESAFGLLHIGLRVLISCLCILNVPLTICRSANTVENVNYDRKVKKDFSATFIFCLINGLKADYLFTEIRRINQQSVK